MPVAHGRRLAELFPAARLVEIPDSYTLVPLDAPGVLAAALREFVSAAPAGAQSAHPHAAWSDREPGD